MRTTMFLLSLLLAGLLGPVLAAHAETPAQSEAEFLCETAPKGTVLDLPDPFAAWGVVVCPPQGQALVPVEGYVWTMVGSLSPISIMAQPPGTIMPPKDGGRSNIRFKKFFGTQIVGAERSSALKRLGIALKDMRVRSIDSVYRLEAISNIYDMRSSIYFYVKDRSPRSIIVCVENCHRMMVLNVLKVGDVARASQPGIR